ncbi:MAG: polyphenol oxidase family protein, partial [Rudaea sp.]
MPEATIVPDWPAPSRVHALTTTRTLPGNSLPPFDAFNLGLRSGEDEATVRANHALLERAFALPAGPRWLHQVHGDRVLRLTSEALDGEPQADAAFTSQPGVVLAILTADCLPILLCADDGSEIAAIHAGWRGLAGGVIEACVSRLATPPARLLAWMGP